MSNLNISSQQTQLRLANSNNHQISQIKPAFDAFIDYSLSGIAYHPDNALHFATQMGDKTQLQTLLDAGFDINATDIFGCTALHIAAANQNVDILQFLIEQGADLNPVSNYIGLPLLFTPLDFAIMNLQDTCVIQFLLQKGAEPCDWSALNNILLSLMYESSDDATTLQVLDIFEAFALTTPNILFLTEEGEIAPTAVILQALCEKQHSDVVIERANQVIELLFDQDVIQVAQRYLAAKNLLLCFPNDEQYEFSADALTHFISSEGHFGSYSAQFASRTLNQFILNYENLNIDTQWSDFQFYPLAVYQNVADAFHLGLDTLLNYGATSAGERFYELYQQGQTFVMPSGWEQHAIDLVFIPEHNLYAVANAGMMYYEFIPGFNAYHPYHVMTPEIFAELSINESEFDLEFSLYYEVGLSHAPDFSFATEPQYMGNCSWYSQMVAEQGLLFIEALNISGDYSQALELSELWFTPLVEYQKTIALQEYLELPSLEFAALGDILFNHHQDFSTNPYSQHRINLILQHIDEHDLISDFESYCQVNPVSEPLHNYIQNLLFDAQLQTEDAWLEQIQPKPSVQPLELHDVISMSNTLVLEEEAAPMTITHDTVESAELAVLVYQPIIIDDQSFMVI